MDSWTIYDLGKESEMPGAEVYYNICLAIHNEQMVDNSSLLKIRNTCRKNVPAPSPMKVME